MTPKSQLKDKISQPNLSAWATFSGPWAWRIINLPQALPDLEKPSVEAFRSWLCFLRLQRSFAYVHLPFSLLLLVWWSIISWPMAVQHIPPWTYPNPEIRLWWVYWPACSVNKGLIKSLLLTSVKGTSGGFTSDSHHHIPSLSIWFGYIYHFGLFGCLTSIRFTRCHQTCAEKKYVADLKRQPTESLMGRAVKQWPSRDQRITNPHILPTKYFHGWISYVRSQDHQM